MSKKRNISKFYLASSIISWIITAVWIILIFKLSGENGTEASERSNDIINIINSLTGVKLTNITLVRKIAHVTEYAILTIFTFISIRFTNKISPETSYAESHVKMMKSDNEMYIGMTLWFTVLCSIFDEYYQLFVDGRDGSIIDTCIDMIGIVVVLLIIRIGFLIYLKEIGKEEYRYEGNL